MPLARDSWRAVDTVLAQLGPGSGSAEASRLHQRIAAVAPQTRASRASARPPEQRPDEGDLLPDRRAIEALLHRSQGAPSPRRDEQERDPSETHSRPLDLPR